MAQPSDVMIMGAEESFASGFAARLQAARRAAHLSARRLAKQSGVTMQRVGELEGGAAVPTDREIGVLAQACQVSVFDLVRPGDTLRVIAPDDSSGAREVEGGDACDALLREYLSMVVELRSGCAITPPTLRRDDLVELAAALGDTPEAIESRLLELLASEAQQPAEAASTHQV